MNGCLRWSDGPNCFPRGAGPRDPRGCDTPAIAADGSPALDDDAVDGNPLPDTDCERRIGVSTRPCAARDMGAAICRPLLSASMMSPNHLGIAVGLVQLDSRALWRPDATFDPCDIRVRPAPRGGAVQPEDAGLEGRRYRRGYRRRPKNAESPVVIGAFVVPPRGFEPRPRRLQGADLALTRGAKTAVDGWEPLPVRSLSIQSPFISFSSTRRPTVTGDRWPVRWPRRVLSPISSALLKLSRRAESVVDQQMLVQTFVDVGPLLTLMSSEDHQILV
jgi:hypothetical protein